VWAAVSVASAVLLRPLAAAKPPSPITNSRRVKPVSRIMPWWSWSVHMVVVSVAVLDEAFRRLKQVGTFCEPIGVASAFSVSEGVIFTKGVFAYFDNQTIVIEKYAQTNNVIIGFEITESTVASTSDTTLLDPAVGASNYIAPGADRYKIALDLATRPLVFDANDDPNFVELLRIEDGLIISENFDPQYSILGDTLARRTYDESGNYIVKPYTLSIIEHLKTSNVASDGYYEAAGGGDDNKIMTIIIKF
jgi:hypothetical protein